MKTSDGRHMAIGLPIILLIASTINALPVSAQGAGRALEATSCLFPPIEPASGFRLTCYWLTVPEDGTRPTNARSDSP